MLINEKVLCAPTNQVRRLLPIHKQQYGTCSLSKLSSLSFDFRDRRSVEDDAAFKQFIPYALVMDSGGRLLCYQRAGSEKRLFARWSAGVGGHVNMLDAADTLEAMLLNGLHRELVEEFGVRCRNVPPRLLGWINEEETEVGHTHLGIVFLCSPDDEVSASNSEASDWAWHTINYVASEQFELWSRLAVKLYTSSL